MCVTCVAEGAMYVGGAGAGLRVMAARASLRRRRGLLPTLSRGRTVETLVSAERSASGVPDDAAPEPITDVATGFSTRTPHL